MIALLLAADPTDPAGLPSLAVYGVASVPMMFLIAGIRWCLQQMSKKDDAIDKLNDKLLTQGDLAIKQAERLAPLIAEAARVIDAAVHELPPRNRPREDPR